MTTAFGILTPKAHQVIQRDGADQADINITGYYSGDAPSSIEARWDGGAWVEIDAAPGNETFNGTLTNQAVGRGTLEVRYSNNHSKADSKENVGIGDVFVIAGQSNASGRGTNNQSYSHATLLASAYQNDYGCGDLVDPVDDSTNQVDMVSSDGGAAAGSCWPLVATEFLNDVEVPLGFIPCAKGGTNISDWEPGAEHEDRLTLYGSMVHRAKNVAGGVKAVLWQQGESDVIDGTTEAAYNTSLDTIADAIKTDLGVDLMAAKVQDIAGEDETAVNTAINTAWGDNANVLTGPDFSAFAPVGDLHFTTDADLQKQAGTDANVGWWDAMKAEWYT